MNHRIINLSYLISIINYDRVNFNTSLEDLIEDFNNYPEGWENVFKDERSWDELSFGEQEERREALIDALENNYNL